MIMKSQIVYVARLSPSSCLLRHQKNCTVSPPKTSCTPIRPRAQAFPVKLIPTRTYAIESAWPKASVNSQEQRTGRMSTTLILLDRSQTPRTRLGSLHCRPLTLLILPPPPLQFRSLHLPLQQEYAPRDTLPPLALPALVASRPPASLPRVSPAHPPKMPCFCNCPSLRHHSAHPPLSAPEHVCLGSGDEQLLLLELVG